MKGLRFFLAISFASVLSLQAQNKIVQFETEAKVIWAGIDRPGDLFLVLTTGEVQKFNKDGKRIGSHGFRTPPTLFEPLDGVQSFYYFQDENVYGNLSSDLVSNTQHHLDPAFAIKPWLVCPSLHELWILDSMDFSIKKTKLNSATILLEAVFKHLPQKRMEDFVYMREYQNYLFLLDKNAGIHFFSSLGKFIQTFEVKDILYFNFLGEEVYYKNGNELIFIDFLSGEKRQITLPQPCRFALVTDEYLYAVEETRVVIYTFKP